MLNVEFYRPIIEFLSLYLGTDTEIILCDTERILLVENPMNENHRAGAPLSEMQQALIQNPDCQNIPYNINYRTLSSKGDKIRSATLFIRDGETLLGRHLDLLISGEQDHNVLQPAKKKNIPRQSYEMLTLSVTEIVDNVLEEATIRFGAPPGRLTTNEKLSVIREMDSRGVFLAKGSVVEVAEKLGSSKATIYRYLHQLDK